MPTSCMQISRTPVGAAVLTSRCALRTQVDAARMAAAQAHLQQRAALEESALPIMLDTMVRMVPFQHLLNLAQ